MNDQPKPTPSPFRSVPPAAPAPRRPADLRTAQEHHKAGRLGEAESAYRRWLGLHAGDAAALHGLGLVNHQAGRQHEAVALLRQAVRTAGNPAVGAVGAAGQGPVVGPTVTYDDDGATIVAETIDTEAAAYEGSLTVDVEPATPTIGLTASGSVDQGCAASLEIDYCDSQGLSDDTLVVDWGDGQQQSLAASSTVDLTHAYANGGTKYTVTVAADSPAGPVSNTTGIDVIAPWSASADYCESIDVVPGAAVEGSPATVDFTAGGNDGRGGLGQAGKGRGGRRRHRSADRGERAGDDGWDDDCGKGKGGKRGQEVVNGVAQSVPARFRCPKENPKIFVDSPVSSWHAIRHNSVVVLAIAFSGGTVHTLHSGRWSDLTTEPGARRDCTVDLSRVAWCRGR
jgi:hypothetical protein